MTIPMEYAEVDEEATAAAVAEQAAKRQKGTDGAATVDEAPVCKKVAFEKVVESWAANGVVEGFDSPAAGTKVDAVRRVRFATFPKYLTIQLRRYVVGDDWQPKKLDAAVNFPEEIDLNHLRGAGLQEGETEMPKGAPSNPGDSVPPAIVGALTAMGFSENAAKRAGIAVSNAGPDQAAEWLFGHIDDPDINDPIPDGQAAAPATADDGDVSQEALGMLTAMGFPDPACRRALQETGNDAARAVDWLTARIDSLDSLTPQVSPSQPPLSDGAGKYELVAFVSHMGRNTGSGHYVCHIKREGRWVLYNDSKVAVSQKTPFGHGYLYFYRRVDA